MRKFLLTLLVLFVVTSFVQAEKMSLETHTFVIDKLERVMKHSTSSDSSFIPTILRLGDLYSERARLKTMAEVEKNCLHCLGSRQDRLTAISKYKTAYPIAEAEKKGRILFQMAHLHELLDQSSKAIDLYNEVIKSEKDRSLVGQSHAGIGDIHFKKNQFDKAIKRFNSALSIKETKDRGYIQYRLAWCYFNSGNENSAIALLEQVLKSPTSLNRSATKGIKFDDSFHVDISRDLTTFYSKQKVTQARVKNVLELSPSSVVKENLYHLAKETDRLGKKRESIFVLSAYLQTNLSKQEQLDAQIRLTYLYYDLGNKNQSITEMREAVRYWKKNGCAPEEKCEEYRTKLRNFVVNWNKSLKDKSSHSLVAAYTLYLSLFQEDVEMNYWAGESAFKLSQWNLAINYYRQASILSNKSIKSGKATKIEKEIFELALLGEIAAAEKLNSLDKRHKAYVHYLQYNPNGKEALQVRYQKAHVAYDQKQYESAANQFRSVALEKTSQFFDIRKKAADLALDSKVFSKDQETIQKWSIEFAQVFPNSKNEFYRISRKSTLNQVASDLNQNSVSRSNAKKTLQKINSVILKGATDDEKKSYYQNKFVAAKAAGDLDHAANALSGLLLISSLSERERQDALRDKLWTQEMKMDFNAAYETQKKISPQRRKEKEHHLKLALLRELSGKNPRSHYNDYLKLEKNNYQANLIRIKLIELASNSRSEWLKQKRYLSSTPDLLALATLKVYSKHQVSSDIKDLLKNRRARNSAMGRVLNRINYLSEFKTVKNQISNHKMNMKSDALMVKTLKKRLDLLAQVEKKANEAVKIGDWSLQIIGLSEVSKQNNRLYKETLEFPVPRNLSDEQKKQYSIALEKKANSYRNASDQINRKIKELWNNSLALEELIAEFNQFNVAEQRAYQSVLKELIVSYRSENNSKLQRALANKKVIPTHREIQVAHKNIKAQPFKINYVEALKQLKERQGEVVYATYLGERVASLKGIGR